MSLSNRRICSATIAAYQVLTVEGLNEAVVVAHGVTPLGITRRPTALFLMHETFI